jgi:hypothetical protein
MNPRCAGWEWTACALLVRTKVGDVLAACDGAQPSPRGASRQSASGLCSHACGAKHGRRGGSPPIAAPRVRGPTCARRARRLGPRPSMPSPAVAISPWCRAADWASARVRVRRRPGARGDGDQRADGGALRSRLRGCAQRLIPVRRCRAPDRAHVQPADLRRSPKRTHLCSPKRTHLADRDSDRYPGSEPPAEPPFAVARTDLPPRAQAVSRPPQAPAKRGGA